MMLWSSDGFSSEKRWTFDRIRLVWTRSPLSDFFRLTKYRKSNDTGREEAETIEDMVDRLKHELAMKDRPSISSKVVTVRQLKKDIINTQ
jgi:hypothetical protein